MTGNSKERPLLKMQGCLSFFWQKFDAARMMRCPEGFYKTKMLQPHSRLAGFACGFCGYDCFLRFLLLAAFLRFAVFPAAAVFPAEAAFPAAAVFPAPAGFLNMKARAKLMPIL